MEVLGLFYLFVIATSIWVFFDAPARGLTWTWGLGCLFLWIIAFPWYLVGRQQYSPLPPRAAGSGHWEADPRDPQLERWREGERWTTQTRPRSQP
jgi:4-amino-4-deoxy-L-arabinose transferase-like glycosyltransferase